MRCTNWMPPTWLVSVSAHSADSPRSRPVWGASFLRLRRWPNWHLPRGLVLQPWQAGCGLSRPCRAALRDEGPFCPPGPMSPDRLPAQLHRSSPPTPRTLRTACRDGELESCDINFPLCCTQYSSDRLTYPLWRYPPLNQTPGCPCFHLCCLLTRCHCLGLPDRERPEQGHISYRRLFLAGQYCLKKAQESCKTETCFEHLTASNESLGSCLWTVNTLTCSFGNSQNNESLTSRPRSCVKVGE